MNPESLVLRVRIVSIKTTIRDKISTCLARIRMDEEAGAPLPLDRAFMALEM
jgi:hypothetical protein